MSTVGMAMIVRDEAPVIERCLETFWDHVDQVSIVDTGSKDDTVEKVRAFAEAKGETSKLKLTEFEWVDDFSAARTAADAQLDTEWVAWIDADDLLTGGDKLRQVAAAADAHVAGFIAGYNYAQDQHGNCICYLKRERLVRRGAGEWAGRVHEAKLIPGELQELGSEIAEWVHRKEHDAAGSPRRNLRILNKWVKDEPDSPRVLGYLGTEYQVTGNHKKAIGYFKRYLKLKTGWDEERAQIHRKLSDSLIALDRESEAVEVALQALKVLPSWPDTYLCLAQAYYKLGEPAKAEQWAQKAIDLGRPDSMLILNPLDYTFQPRFVRAAALGALGRLTEAIALADEALTILPDHADLRNARERWRATIKRAQTAETFVGCAELLIAHDEQLKALDLLEGCVPHYCADHERIVQTRSFLRERLAFLKDDRYAERYESQEIAPEQFVGDGELTGICEQLPRCEVVLDSLTLRQEDSNACA